MLKKLLPVTLLIAFGFSVIGQTFTSNTGTIPDSGCEGFRFDLTNANLPNEEDGTGTATLTQVCFDITHPNVSDLIIFLTSPNSVTVELSIANGGSAANYTGTCFTSTATESITAANAPFTGDFLAQQDIDLLNDGLSPNGEWVLRICDIADGNTGTVNSTELVFESVLPVTLSQFSAKENKSANEINWMTSTEINVENHTVLRSVNAKDWMAIATVDGNAWSTSSRAYTVTDERPFDLTYYRLMTTDIDGSLSYSGVVSVNRSASNIIEMSASPVPTQNDVNISLSSLHTQSVVLTVNDLSGRTILESTRNIEEGSNLLSVDLSELAAGSYIVSLRSRSINESVRVIKN